MSSEKPLWYKETGDFAELIEYNRSMYGSSFSSLMNNLEKIQYFSNNDDIQQNFNIFIQKNLSFQAKDEKKSKICIENGHKYFLLENYEEALKYFSKAILYAPYEKPFEIISLAFINHSLVLFSLNQFEQCLNSIDSAIDLGYSGDKLHLILMKKSLCLKALKRNEEALETLKMVFDIIDKNAQMADISKSEKLKRSFQHDYENFELQITDSLVQQQIRKKYYSLIDRPILNNPKIMGANQFVKLCNSLGKGRYLKVCSAVKKNEIILKEEPFACVLDPSYYETFCHHCCIQLNNNLYPCSSCALVRFCSKKCASLAADQYHSYECKYLSLLHLTGNVRLSLRILLRGKIDNAIKMFKRCLSKKTTSNNYASILTLIKHSMCDHVIDTRQTLVACFYLYLISEYMKLIDRSHNNYNLIGNILLTHIQQISVNSVVIFFQPIFPVPFFLQGIDAKNTIIAQAIYPSLSLVNHSCSPNIELMYIGSKLIAISNRSLEQGEEITITYGPLYKMMSRLNRLKILKSKYCFDCECTSCNFNNIKTNKIQGYVLAEALLCPLCKGPFIMISETIGGKCLQCNEIKKEIDTKNDLENAKKCLDSSKTLMSNSTNEAVHILKKSLSYLLRICSENNRLLYNVYTYLLDAYLMLGQYDKAQENAELCLKISRTIFGDNSPEYIGNKLIKIKSKYYQLKDHRNSNYSKKIVQQLIKEIDDAIEESKGIIKSNEILPDFILIESTIAKCLKETLFLQKLKNSLVK